MIWKAKFQWLGSVVLVFLTLTSAARAQFPLVLETKVVDAGIVMTFTVTSTGAIDLSKFKNIPDLEHPQVIFVDPFVGPGEHTETGISPKSIDPTVRKLTVTASMSNPGKVNGSAFRQMLLIFGDVTVSFNFTLNPPFVCPASCQLPKKCVNKQCVLLPTACKPRCQEPRFFCNEERKRCEQAQ